MKKSGNTEPMILGKKNSYFTIKPNIKIGKEKKTFEMEKSWGKNDNH